MAESLDSNSNLPLLCIGKSKYYPTNLNISFKDIKEKFIHDIINNFNSLVYSVYQVSKYPDAPPMALVILDNNNDDTKFSYAEVTILSHMKKIQNIGYVYFISPTSFSSSSSSSLSPSSRISSSSSSSYSSKTSSYSSSSSSSSSSKTSSYSSSNSYSNNGQNRSKAKWKKPKFKQSDKRGKEQRAKKPSSRQNINYCYNENSAIYSCSICDGACGTPNRIENHCLYCDNYLHNDNNYCDIDCYDFDTYCHNCEYEFSYCDYLCYHCLIEELNKNDYNESNEDYDYYDDYTEPCRDGDYCGKCYFCN